MAIGCKSNAIRGHMGKINVIMTLCSFQQNCVADNSTQQRVHILIWDPMDALFLHNLGAVSKFALLINVMALDPPP